ncbi:GD21961 [Drosophila simulans]|nr:GD21961 [Drosophila simulans]
MASMKSSEKKRIVPLSADLLSDIMTHRNEYHTPPGHYIEGEQVGDNRASGQYATTSSPQSLPSGARRRTVCFADGPIVATTTALELRPSVGQTRLETRLDSLPKPNSQYEEPCTGGLHCLRRSQSHLSLSFKSSSDMRLVNSYSDLHLRDEKSLDNRHRNRQFNLDLQKHLANMLKTRTSLFLSQRKE